MLPSFFEHERHPSPVQVRASVSRIPRYSGHTSPCTRSICLYVSCVHRKSLILPCVDHLNTDRFDNRVENLRWCTYSENNLNPITSSKKHKPVVQIKDGTVIHIYESIRAATEHGFSLSCIIACCRGKNVSHRGFRWMYLSDYETLVNKSKNSIPDTVYPQ